MKKIILIGDSTRMGYDKYVKEALEGAAEVYYAPENGRYALNVLRFAHDWKNKYEWPEDADLVYWNAGLWDVIEMFGDEPLVPVDCYANAIPRVDKRLRMLFPKAKMVFATSVSVIEDRCGPNFKRRNSVIEQYNEVAKKALSATDTVIHDLYALTKNTGGEYRTDAVHFYTDLGRELMGGLVLAELTKELGIDAAEVKLVGFDPEKYSAENVGY
ncbi:MAG: SGNH/GDSL hydrolase family protein [Clostridia bacterium]|nr:SGNH/GDSL hydrolase family protein [Clostridia bacterium]